MSFGAELYIAALANLLGAGMTLPQVIRIIRTRKVAGVSPVWAALSVTVNAWWLAYAAGVADPAIVPVSVLGVAGYLLILGALNRLGEPLATGSLLAPVVVVAAVPLLGLLTGGWESVGPIVGVLYGVQLAPAVIDACRSRELSGISPGTWTLAWFEAALWGAYGTSRGDTGLVALAVMGVTLSSVVLLRVAWWTSASRAVAG